MKAWARVIATPYALATLIGWAWAQDSLYIPLAIYRTGSFAASGTPIANGM